MLKHKIKLEILADWPDLRLYARLAEVGGFLGGSMRRWLQAHSKLRAVLLERSYYGSHGAGIADVVSVNNWDGRPGTPPLAPELRNNLREELIYREHLIM